MSNHKEAGDIDAPVFWTGSSSDNAGRAFHWADAAPLGGESGYMEGCIWIANSPVAVYINAGSATSASWLTITLS